MNPTRRATIDADGNIILPHMDDVPPPPLSSIPERAEEGATEQFYDFEDSITNERYTTLETEMLSIIDEESELNDVEQNPAVIWTIIEDEIVSESKNSDHDFPKAMHIEQAKAVWTSVRGNVYSVAGGVIQESTRQYKTSVIDGTVAGAEAVRSLRRSAQRFWGFLKQPVWIPNRKKQPVQYSRGALFLIDTVRFGGTFALLFSALFAAMNYQSFSTIAFSYIEPLAQITGIVQAKETDEQVADTLMGMLPSNKGTDAKDSAQYLPPVGPPENRLVIPKLHLNIPIVIPPMDALIAEDWKKLEEDIQTGLRNGVVHYPGTARPGKPGNFFVTGHSSYFPWDSGKYKAVFARLGELSVGDEYWVFYNGDRHRYVVKDKKEIKPADVSVLDQPVDARISTLMTCTPIGTTLFRLIITAQEVDPVSGEVLAVGQHSEPLMPKVKMEMLPI